MKAILVSVFFSIAITVSAQTEEYKILVKQADDFYANGNYTESAKKYNEAFATTDGKAAPNDRYNAACSWALSNVVDSSFYHLNKLAKEGDYQNYRHISTDTDLISLYKDIRWDELLQQVQHNKDEAEKDFDKPLVALLDSVLDEDQKYRNQINALEKKFGRESPEIRTLFNTILEVDSVNLIIVSKVLDEKGWLGPKTIGNNGSSTLFLVVQHSPIEVQLKYLPMMRDAVKQGNANASNLSLLEDRVALRQGKKQIYGSQIGFDKETDKYIVQDLEDPENVDKRRAEVGLSPLTDYVKNWGIIWDVEQYKNSKKVNNFITFD